MDNNKHSFKVTGSNLFRRVYIHNCEKCGIKAVEHFDQKGNFHYNEEKECKPKTTKDHEQQ